MMQHRDAKHSHFLLLIVLGYLYPSYRISAVSAAHYGSDIPDNVRVPRGGTLPPASFRLHLAMDTLALG